MAVLVYIKPCPGRYAALGPPKDGTVVVSLFIATIAFIAVVVHSERLTAPHTSMLETGLSTTFFGPGLPGTHDTSSHLLVRSHAVSHTQAKHPSCYPRPFDQCSIQCILCSARRRVHRAVRVRARRRRELASAPNIHLQQSPLRRTLQVANSVVICWPGHVSDVDACLGLPACFDAFVQPECVNAFDVRIEPTVMALHNIPCSSSGLVCSPIGIRANQ